MFNCNQFRELIVQSTLKDLLLYSPNAEELLVFTCAVESLGGTYLHQVNGPALGIYQMEPTTYTDIWQNYLKHNPKLSLILLSNFHVVSMPFPEQMIYDLRFATAMARIFYVRVNLPLPPLHNIDEIWNYYKTHYNTSAGDAEKEDAINKYLKFVKN